jgi:hypothetical protein
VSRRSRRGTLHIRANDPVRLLHIAREPLAAP